MSGVPVVAAVTVTRHYVACERCQSQPMLWGGGYADLGEAEEAAQKHRDAHVAQPYCICDTVPSVNYLDDDDEDVDGGHGHCRHQGRCCECGCMTKEPRPTGTTSPGEPR